MQDGASGNWAQTSNPAPRPGPAPAATQSVSSENPQVATSQRALAWTGHLEWQDTVCTVLTLIKNGRGEVCDHCTSLFKLIKT